MLAVTVHLLLVSFFKTHTISFRLAELIPYKSCLGDGLCCWLGRSDLHWSHVKMLLVGLLFPVAERDASYFHPHLPLSLPEDTRTMWDVKEIKLCEKNPRLHRSWHFLQWLGIWKKISHGGSLNLRGSLLLPERATSATGVGSSLCSSSTCRSLRAESTLTSCPECEDVHSSATLFAIVAERMQRSTVGLHHEQHLCLRSVT